MTSLQQSLSVTEQVFLESQKYTKMIKPDVYSMAAKMIAAPIVDVISTGFFTAFSVSFFMIVMSELGDKTFFIAALMSMRSNHWSVFLGALGALILMTFLSVVAGAMLPMLIDRRYTHYASVLLFFFFGIRSIMQSAGAAPGHEHDELHEVEAELNKKTELVTLNDLAVDTENPDDRNCLHLNADYKIERRDTTLNNSKFQERKLYYEKEKTSRLSWLRLTKFPRPRHSHYDTLVKSIHQLRSRLQISFMSPLSWFSKLCNPVVIQAFTMTFLAEWGDRSQIATVALAASKDVVGVSIGAISGHAVCTSLAVLGGKMLASRVSEKTINILSGCLFLFFGMIGIIFSV